MAQALLPRKPKGLVAAYEMLVITPAISNLIRENKTYRIDSSIQTGRKHGMILLDDSLFNLWRQGLVDEEEVLFKARKFNDLRERILHTVNHREGSRRKLAARFGVDTPTLTRGLQLRRQTGSSRPGPHGGGTGPTRDQDGLERPVVKVALGKMFKPAKGPRASSKLKSLM